MSYNNEYSVKDGMDKVGILEHMVEKLDDRGGDYGSARINHSRASEFIEVYLRSLGWDGPELSPSQSMVMMMLIKIARLSETPGHLDSMADIIGYGACAYESISEGDHLTLHPREE